MNRSRGSLEGPNGTNNDIPEEPSGIDSNSSSEVEDTTSSSSEGSDSSIDAALGEESELALMKKLEVAQDKRMNGEETKEDPKDVMNLVEKNMINLLRACSMLTRPSEEDINLRKVAFGDKIRQKTLILDMDETLIHSKFIRLKGNEADAIPEGLIMNEDG